MKNISVRVNDELHRLVTHSAKERGLPLSNFVRISLQAMCRQEVASDSDTIVLLREQLQAKDTQLERTDSEIQYLREQVSRLTQVVAMSQKNIGALTEQLDDSRQMIEDMRSRSWWKRILRR